MGNVTAAPGAPDIPTPNPAPPGWATRGRCGPPTRRTFCGFVVRLVSGFPRAAVPITGGSWDASPPVATDQAGPDGSHAPAPATPGFRKKVGAVFRRFSA